MSYPTVEELVTKYGYSRAAAEQEVKRTTCAHDFGDRCMSSGLGIGCYRTCQKCGQMVGLGRHCWEKKKGKSDKETR